MESTAQILIVDNDLAVHPTLAKALRERGLQVETVVSAEQALRMLAEQIFEVAVLDLNLSGTGDSRELFQAIRERSPKTITIWTGHLPRDLALLALPKGASDYLPKPIVLAHLIEVIQRNLKLHHGELQHDGEPSPPVVTPENLAQEPSSPVDAEAEFPIITIGDLVIDPLRSIVLRAHQPVPLSPSEFSTLNYLVSHIDHVVTAEELAKATGSDAQLNADTGPMVRAKIKRLRRKLGDDARNPRYILNVRGKGYRFQPQAIPSKNPSTLLPLTD